MWDFVLQRNILGWQVCTVLNLWGTQIFVRAIIVLLVHMNRPIETQVLTPLMRQNY